MGKLILLFLLLCIVGFVVAIKMLPWWGIVLLLVGLPVLGILSFKFLLKKLFLLPFKAKGAVLRGATATIHSIERATTRPMDVSPENDDETNADAEPEPRDYYWLDVTIMPKTATGKFKLWEAGELMLVAPDAKSPDQEDSDDDTCNVKKLEVEEEGQFKVEEGYKYDGAKRLRMLLAVKQGVKTLKFRYYFEDFGNVRLA